MVRSPKNKGHVGPSEAYWNSTVLSCLDFMQLFACGLTLCPVWFWMPIWHSPESPEKGLNLGIVWLSLACRHVSGAVSWLLIDVRRLGPRWATSFPEQVILSCLRKKLAKHGPKSNPVSGVPPQFLPWLLSMMDCDLEVQPNELFPPGSCFLTECHSTATEGDEHLGPSLPLRSILLVTWLRPYTLRPESPEMCSSRYVFSKSQHPKALSIACLNLNAGIKGIITPHQTIMFLSSSCLNT